MDRTVRSITGEGIDLQSFICGIVIFLELEHGEMNMQNSVKRKIWREKNWVQKDEKKERKFRV